MNNLHYGLRIVQDEACVLQERIDYLNYRYSIHGKERVLDEIMELSSKLDEVNEVLEIIEDIYDDEYE